MKNFDKYSKVYDLLYSDKDYLAEAKYISDHIQKYVQQPKTLLDLGCGTGRHAEHFSINNFRVIGIDKSLQNLRIAKSRINKGSNVYTEPIFFAADLEDYSINVKADAVVSLFHVICYLTRTDQLIRAFRNTRNHIKKGGIFLFDLWYGPAVISQRPQAKLKSVSSDTMEVVRITDPAFHVNRNTVDVNFKVMVTEKGSSVSNSFSETHSMRYFFLPEIDYYLNISGFHVIHACEWLTGANLSEDSWNILIIARAV